MISRVPFRLVRSFKAMAVAQMRMPFGSSVEMIDKTKQKLQKIVEKELKYEKTNYAADETAKDFIDSKGFQVFESEGDNEVELVKSVGDVKVLINFQSRSPNQMDQEQNEEQQENQEQEQEQQDSDFADFTVYLTKSNGQTLCYECSSISSEIQVNMVSIVENVDEHKKIPRFQRGIENYSGPDFQTLDERLQTALVEYLKGYGINEELAAFVEHYSLDKEQRLYMQWLDSLTTYLKN